MATERGSRSGQRVRIITVYLAHDAHGYAGFVSKWHARLDERASSDEQREISRLLDEVCAVVYGVIERDRPQQVC